MVSGIRIGENKRMKIYVYVDWMGGMFETPEEEYEQIKIQLELALETDKFIYKTEIPPWKLENEKVDVYIIDFGGLLPGSEDSIRSIYRELIKQIEEKPNTLFILWSHFTCEWYADVMEEVAPDLKGFNVIKRPPSKGEDYRHWEEKLRDWVGKE